MKRLSLLFVVLLAFARLAGAATTQSPVPEPSGMDRIDQRVGTNHSYTYDGNGAGVRIYIVDTGVGDIPDLQGRLTHRNFATDPRDVSQRQPPLAAAGACIDHGTNVASLAAGTEYGVAKGASVVDVRFEPCSLREDGLYYSTSVTPNQLADYFVAALNNIATTHPAGQPGVVNISSRFWYGTDYPNFQIDPTKRAAVDAAVRNLAIHGLVVAIAGTEHGGGACSDTTASLGTWPGIIAVSSSTLADGYRSGTTEDPSNTGSGPCIDIFAPTGIHAVQSLNFGGTSASTPLVSGAAAIFLGMNPWMDADDIELWIKESATKNILTGVPFGTTNALLHSRPALVSVNPGVLQPGQTGYGFVAAESGATYSWTIQNGTIVGPNNGTSVQFTAGCGQVILKATLTVGTQTKTGYGRVLVTLPTASLAGGGTVEYPQSATLYVSFTGTGPWTVIWSDGLQETYSTAQGTRTVTPSETTTYTLDYVRDGIGCTGTRSGYATITVTGCAPASTAIAVPPSVYAGSTSYASLPYEEGATYSWNVVNGSMPTPQETNVIQFSVGCSGVTTVNVTVTRACGTQSSGSATVAAILPTVSISGTQTIQSGQSAWLLAEYTGSLPWSITWSDGVTQYNITKTWLWRQVTPTTTRTYTATSVRNYYGCAGTSSGSATVTVQ